MCCACRFVWALITCVCARVCVCVRARSRTWRRNLLDVGVGTDDVLNLIRVGVLEGEAAGSDQHPLPVLHAETVHDRQDLTLQLHHLHNEHSGQDLTGLTQDKRSKNPEQLPPCGPESDGSNYWDRHTHTLQSDRLFSKLWTRG